MINFWLYSTGCRLQENNELLNQTLHHWSLNFLHYISKSPGII